MFFKPKLNAVWTYTFEREVRVQGVFAGPEGLALRKNEYKTFTE